MMEPMPHPSEIPSLKIHEKQILSSPWHQLHPSLKMHPDVQELSSQYAFEKDQARRRTHLSQGIDHPVHSYYASQKTQSSPQQVFHALLQSWLVSPKSALGLQEAIARIFHLQFSGKIDKADQSDILGRGRRRFVRALYQQTQDSLQSKTDTSLMLYRPLFTSPGKGGTVLLEMAPLSSWTDKKEVALRAAREGKGKALLSLIAQPQDVFMFPGSKETIVTLPHEYVIVGRGQQRGLISLLEVRDEQTLPQQPTERSKYFQKGFKTKTHMRDPILRPDDSIKNADWLRSLAWSIYPSTADGLLMALSVDDAPQGEKRSAVLHFMSLPAAGPMPSNVRTELISRGLLTPYDEDPRETEDPEEMQEESQEQLQEPD